MSLPFKRISPGTSLSDQVAEAIAAEIRSGRLAVGSKLPTEAALVMQFSVSRTVVREAVSQLKSLGLVDSRQGSGVFVKEPGFSPLNFDVSAALSQQAVVQMVEVRRALETEVAGLAAERRSAAQVAQIREAIARLDAAVEAGADGVAEDVQFHRAIADAANNPFLIATLDYLSQFLVGATRVTRANEARRDDFTRQVGDEHLAILRAIEAGDVLAARQAASLHMQNAVARIRRADPVFWAQAGVQLAQPLVKGLVAKPAMKQALGPASNSSQKEHK